MNYSSVELTLTKLIVELTTILKINQRMLMSSVEFVEKLAMLMPIDLLHADDDATGGYRDERICIYYYV